MVDVSIIFVNYKTEDFLLACLKSIKEYTHGLSYEFIVVDNSFSLGNNKQILNAFPETSWIDAGGNVGFSAANNIGAKQAKGKFLLFLNTDTLLFDNAIANAINFLERKTNFVAIGGLQLNAALEPIPYFYSLNDLRKDFYFVPNHPIFQRVLRAFLPTEKFDPSETNNLVGAFILLSQDAFKKVGGWDEQFFMYAEDAELSYRLSKLGKLGYTEEVKFIHLVKGNEFTRINDSWANRFSVQIQLSNLLWIRKSYGILSLLLIYLNYALFLPIFWGWKLYRNLVEKKSILSDVHNQLMLSRKIGILITYLPKLVFLSAKSFKIRPEENIGRS